MFSLSELSNFYPCLFALPGGDRCKSCKHFEKPHSFNAGLCQTKRQTVLSEDQACDRYVKKMESD